MAWLKVSELAAEYGVSASAVRAWIKDGMPSARGPGNVTVVDPEAAEEWLDALEDEEEHDEAEESEEGENEPEPEDEEDGLEDGDEDGEDEDDEDGEDE